MSETPQKLLFRNEAFNFTRGSFYSNTILNHFNILYRNFVPGFLSFFSTKRFVLYYHDDVILMSYKTQGSFAFVCAHRQDSFKPIAF